MTLEQLLALLSDNSEAKTFVTSLNEKATNADTLITKVNGLESKNAEIIASRKNQDGKYKEMLKLLGVEELTPEAVESFKKTGKGGDAALVAELENVKGLLEKATNESQTITSDYEGKLQSMALRQALANAGLGANVANEAMYKIVADLVSDGAVFENDTVVYKKGDVTTYGADGKPLTLEGKISELKANENYTGLFKTDIKPGGGTSPNQNRPGGGTPKDTKGISATEMMKTGRK